MKKKKKISWGQIVLHILFILLSLTYILPFLLLISISITDEQAITDFGYKLIPPKVSFEGYRMLFNNSTQIINSYKTTATYSIAATIYQLVLTAMTAYPLSRSNFKYKKQLTWFLFITMLFGGGLVSSYLVNTRLLHLDDTIWIYILGGVSAWNVIIVRTFFQGIPESLAESAKIDGASEFYILLRIMVPLSVPVFATLGFMSVLGKWNDWNTSLLYIKKPELYSLQYMLQRILREVDFMRKMAEQDPNFVGLKMPEESLRYATAMVATGPMMLIFPFFQKYFTKGMLIGSVKG